MSEPSPEFQTFAAAQVEIQPSHKERGCRSVQSNDEKILNPHVMLNLFQHLAIGNSLRQSSDIPQGARERIAVKFGSGYRKIAFTLAEVLITLGIIGIVAAMTMPSLLADIRAKELKSRFNKTYAELNEAAKLFTQDTGMAVRDHSINTYGGSGSNNDATLKFFLEHSFKGVNKTNTDTSIYADTGYNLNGAPAIGTPCDRSYIYTDITGRMFSMDDNVSIYSSEIVTGPKICVDINGKSLPNTWGIDRFVFVFDENNAVVPYTGLDAYDTTPQITDENQIKKYCSTTVTTPPHTCAYFALKNKSPDGNGTYWGDFIKGR